MASGHIAGSLPGRDEQAMNQFTSENAVEICHC